MGRLQTGPPDLLEGFDNGSNRHFCRLEEEGISMQKPVQKPVQIPGQGPIQGAVERFRKRAGDLYCFADDLDICIRLLKAGARIIQMRNKHLDDGAFRSTAEEMLGRVHQYRDGVLIINDRAGIALDIGADGIHLGQEDGDYKEVIQKAQRLGKRMIIGVSVDTAEEATEARNAGASYVGAGAAFPTPSKSDAVIIGLDGIAQVVQAVDIPVVAIGGITLENLPLVMETGADFFAVISDINRAEDLDARVAAYQQRLGR